MSNQRIIYQNESGGVSIIIPAPGYTILEAQKAVPEGISCEIKNKEDIPSDRTFRNAWEKSGSEILHNMNKVKNIAHEKRRNKREQLFAPYDDIIMKQIPGKNLTEAENARVSIRNQDASVQSQIDAASTPEQVKIVLQSYGI